MNSIDKPKFYILDGTSLVYRTFYAIQNLSNSKGFPTNSIFGFTKTLQKVLREKTPQHFVAVFDAKGPTFRHQEFLDYKIQRKPMPHELTIQLPWIRDIVKAYGLPILEISGYEADDVIATIALAAKKDFEVLIFSPDKDMLQLIEPGIRVIPNPAENNLLDEEKVKVLYGIPPKKIADYLALTGDSSDNIPGVSGIGPKSATLLLQDYDSLEALLEGPWTQKGRILKSRLMSEEKEARLSKRLATLRFDVPIDFTVLRAKILPSDTKALAKIFQELEFQDLLKDVVPLAPLLIQSKTIHTLEESSLMKQSVIASGEIGISLHLEETPPLPCKLSGISLATVKSIFYVPFENKNALGVLNEILAESSLQKYAYDVKKIKLILDSESLHLAEPTFDIMIAAFLANPAQHFKNSKALAASFLNRGYPLSSPIEESAQEAMNALELKPILKELLVKSNQDHLYDEIEHPLIDVLANMEKTGIPIDVEQLKIASSEFQAMLSNLEKTIHHLAGETFNINSPKDISKILFEKLKLPVGRKTKTGYSTNADVLQTLIDRHEIVPNILKYREISKLKSTYVDALPLLVSPRTGRLHTTFSQTSAETGRLASLNPNLQNIPIRSTLSKKIREAFIAPDPETLLLSADYSQIELRILAHFSNDRGLLEAFEKDEDIHRWTAQAVFNIPAVEISESQRSRAKAINFGIVYGMGAFGLSKELGISFEEAQSFIDQYHERFPNVKNFIINLLENARKTGYVTTLFNRRRYLPELSNPNLHIRQMGERMAVNTPIQGTAADLTKLAMIAIDRDLRAQALNSKIVLQIHDELIFLVPKNEEAILRQLVKHRMETIIPPPGLIREANAPQEPAFSKQPGGGITPLNVKLKVNIQTGKNWMEL